MTKKEIYKQVFQMLEQKRNNEIFVAEKNKSIALSNSEYFNLDFKEKILNMEIGKLKFEGEDYSQKEDELQRIKEEQQEVLKSLNLLGKDLEPQFDCQKCKDTGIFENSICSCAAQMANNIVMQGCGVDLSKVPTLRDYDYKFFDDEKEQSFAKKCVKILTDYVNNLNSLEMKNVVMCGASGTGKTYLTRCIAKEFVQKGYTTLFISAFDLNNMFLEEHLSTYEQKEHLKNLMETDCLIIDDLGTEPMRKNVTKEYLLLLLNERLTKNKATIITSNLSPEQILNKYEERIFSRIFNKRSSLILEFNGKNNRLKK